MSKDNPRLEFVSLFSGAGGLEYTGWHCLYAADNEPSAVASLKRNQQAGFAARAVIAVADVRRLTGAEILEKIGRKIGLPKKVILAIECKVWNDKTNSIKRVNDVLKKATAWKRQWAEFVVTGALLQGVFSAKEPRRLMDNDVEVFWSHRTDFLLAWLDQAETL